MARILVILSALLIAITLGRLCAYRCRLFYIAGFPQGPVSGKMYKSAYARLEDSDQAAHLRSLIKVFDGRSMGGQGSTVSSDGKLRL